MTFWALQTCVMTDFESTQTFSRHGNMRDKFTIEKYKIAI